MKAAVELFEVLFAVVVVEADSACGGGLEFVHEKLAAMVAGADGDAFVVEDAGDVVRVCRCCGEGNDWAVGCAV